MNLTANASDLFTEIHNEVFAVVSNAARPLNCGEVCDGITGIGYSYGEVRQALKDLTEAGKVTVKSRAKVLVYTSR
jgi:hypothetical protein